MPFLHGGVPVRRAQLQLGTSKGSAGGCGTTILAGEGVSAARWNGGKMRLLPGHGGAMDASGVHVGLSDGRDLLWRRERGRRDQFVRRDGEAIQTSPGSLGISASRRVGN